MSKITFSKENYIICDGKRTGTYVRQGSYWDTPDNRLDRWYLGEDDYGFRPFGAGYRTRQQAAQEWLEQWRPWGR